MALNQLRLPSHGEGLLSVVTAPTPFRKPAFQPLGVKPEQNVPIRLPSLPASAALKEPESQKDGNKFDVQPPMKLR